MEKISINGITLVTKELAKELKTLGWCWESPALLQLSTGEILTPQRKIDTNIGNEFAPLPAIQQVISWLELWNIRISWDNIERIDDTEYYSLIKFDSVGNWLGSGNEVSFSGKWRRWENMILEVLPKVIKLIKKEICKIEFILHKSDEGDEFDGGTIYFNKPIYDKMIKLKAIVPTNFYDFSKKVDYKILEDDSAN